jgi:CBS domain-containing protein
MKQVRDVMSRSIVTCTPETTVRKAASRMVDNGVNALVVVDESSGELEGIVSPADLIQTYGQNIGLLTVDSVMSEQVETIIPDIPVSAAILIMLDRGVDRLVIVHAPPAPQRPVGILSVSDVVRAMAGAD